MAEERVDVTLPDLVRWLVIAVVMLVGIGLYFRFGAATRPVITAVGQEATS